MLFAVLVVVGGLALLVWSADRFVFGASAIAGNLGVSPLLVGLTVVGIGTSAPEMLVSGMAAYGGVPGLAVGNAIGSNIANIALVLGVTAIIAPMAVASTILRHELPLMIIVMLLVFCLLWDGELGRTDGIALLVGTILFIAWIIREGLRSQTGEPMADEFKAELPAALSTARAAMWVVIGLGMLLLASRLIVYGAIDIATALGVSDFLIGLTIIAVGTSLPELAASVMSAHKGEPDIAIGNVIGSNIFNLLPVLAIPGLVAPGGMDAGVMERDYPVMLLLTIALVTMIWRFKTPGRITRTEGIALVACYAGYIVLLYFTNR